MVSCVLKECIDERVEGEAIKMPVDEVVNGHLPVNGQTEKH